MTMSDLLYRPVLGDIGDVILTERPIRALFIGEEVHDASALVDESRYLEGDGVDLPTGVYTFAVDGSVMMLAVSVGAAPGAPCMSNWSAPDDDPLVMAYGWFCHLWELAAEVPKPSFNVGDEVVTVPQGQEAVVRSRTFDHGAWWYEVRTEGRTVTFQESKLRTPDLDDDPAVWIGREPADVGRWAATLTRAKLRERLTDTVFSFRATRTIFRPYQFRPVMRLLSTGSLRLLIADEVGLGKTIEAGLVWTELDARRQAGRVLVVCPSMLVPKWKAEMDERFGYDLRELDRAGLDDLLDRVEADRLPSRFHAVCSIERLRVWDGLQRLAEISPRFDLVIVDEAHAFRNSGTRSHTLGALLSDWADALVFLSATPLNLGNEDLYNLLELLAPGEFDDRHTLEQRLEPNAVLNRISSTFFDHGVTNEKRRSWLRSIPALAFGPAVSGRPEFSELDSLLAEPVLEPAQVARAKRLISQLHALAAVVCRTRKVEIQDRKAVREAHPIDVEWTDTEWAFYTAFDAWQRASALKRGLPVGFVTQMPLRLASTCLPAARDKVLSRRSTWNDDYIGGADDEDWEADDIAPPPELIELARSMGDVDTKFDAFVSALLPIVSAGRRVLVFTFSRAALAYLRRRLDGVVRANEMHGDIAKDDRHDVMRRFRNHEFDVLLASRVASEGLDFEFCSAVVNYDLPWNPMEVEQRIGRIDRFGQEEDKILVLNFHTPGTIETDIIERVHRRIGVFTDSIGELEPILQSRVSELRRTMFDFSLTDEQRERRLDEVLAAIEEQRLSREDVETAASYLSSTDGNEIDGLEADLVSHGRYVGQPELVRLLGDWTAIAGAPQPRVVASGRRMVLRGNPQMEVHLRGVQAAGERSGSELEAIARSLRDEEDVALCLDQELARRTGEPILSATHPLVRGALRVPGYTQSRFSHVAFSTDDVPSGMYFVLVSVARWTGLRSSAEFWTTAVPLDGSGEPAAEIGDALLAALADGALGAPATEDRSDLGPALRAAQSLMRQRQAAEETRRTAENASLVDTRLISLRETHSRKVGQINRRIATLRAGGKTSVIHLQEAQLRNQERLLAEAEDRLQQAGVGSMEVEHVAACIATVETATP